MKLYNCRIETLSRMVVAISKKRCGFYTHLSKKNYYNEASEAFLTLLMNSKTIEIQKPNPRR
jgi:hypothetical protein